MLPFAFEVNNFFPFRETFVSPGSQSFFFNREERLCSSSFHKSITFLHLGEIRRDPMCRPRDARKAL